MSELGAVDGNPVIPHDLPADPALLAGRRRPNVPLVPEGDAGGDVEDTATEVGGDDIVEQVGEAIFRDTDDRLDTAPERAALGDDIDGLDGDQRTPGEQSAIDTTLNDLDSGDTLDVEVIAVDAGQVDTIQTDSGDVTQVFLGEGEGSRLIEVAPDEVVLIIADDLSVAETVEEVVEANAQLITEVAEGNGVVVDGEGLRAALFFSSEAVIQNYFQMRFFGGLRTEFVQTVIDDIRTRIGEEHRPR